MRVRPSTTFLTTLLLSYALIGTVSGQYAKKHTSFEEVVEQAQELSQKPYKPVKSRLPDEFLNLDYDGYRKITWNPEQSLWKPDNLNFRLEFFHPGYLFQTPVQINEFSESHIQTIPFTPEFFEYGDPAVNPRRISRKANYAGFRLLFPLNEGEKFDEVLSFLGASYFRALGTGQRYGKSARALAINTGLDKPEEFPVFREFWIGKPDPESVKVQIFGLLDSPSVAGAYQFDVRPGKVIFIDVKAVLFFRQAVDWLGIAPLTSMYWYGENFPGAKNDFRPEVHDSDGLLLETAEGPVWRVLANDGRKRNYVYEGSGIQGFGLMQRDRNFDHYQDLEAWYQAHPSVWIEPLGSWGDGSVELIEFPTDNEFFDNVVSAWVPDKMPALSVPYPVAYRLHWTKGEPKEKPLARVVSTRFGKPMNGSPATQFVVEFSRLADQADSMPETLAADFTGSGHVSISEVKVINNPLNSNWRVVFLVDGSEPADLACRLLLDGQSVSERWSYPWKPN